jgi:hypothetical protein
MLDPHCSEHGQALKRQDPSRQQVEHPIDAIRVDRGVRGTLAP